jgi:hypothetical protein
MVAPIYVEAHIRGAMADLWARTQDPRQHQRWDLRFTKIVYLPRPDPAAPQRFRYTTRIGFGLTITGLGETTATREGPGGRRTSALTFWSDHPRSLIRRGAGYWQYTPTRDGIRFVTRYDYDVRFGRAGHLLDRMVFRPLIGWATAWSFDRLRLWVEQGVAPEDWLRHALACRLDPRALPLARRCRRQPGGAA